MDLLAVFREIVDSMIGSESKEQVHRTATRRVDYVSNH